MTVEYYICDVFTNQPFGGNPLAVIPDARGLSDQQMQQIAREFNFSESTFVLPSELPQCDARVRIFTPSREVPFAGHPNVGTAFVLDAIGAQRADPSGMFHFEEQAGIVPVEKVALEGVGDGFRLRAPEQLTLGEPLSVELIAQALSLSAAQINTHNHAPIVASVGLPFILVELSDEAALASCKLNTPVFEQILNTGVMPDIHAYVLGGQDVDIQTRMFAPLDGVPEDPATGSANCALAGLLAHLNQDKPQRQQWRIAQGDEMGRPSRLYAEVTQDASGQVEVYIAGQAVMFSRGTLCL